MGYFSAVLIISERTLVDLVHLRPGSEACQRRDMSLLPGSSRALAQGDSLETSIPLVRVRERNKTRERERIFDDEFLHEY
jgi:hypothetical protein